MQILTLQHFPVPYVNFQPGMRSLLELTQSVLFQSWVLVKGEPFLIACNDLLIYPSFYFPVEDFL